MNTCFDCGELYEGQHSCPIVREAIKQRTAQLEDWKAIKRPLFLKEVSHIRSLRKEIADLEAVAANPRTL